MSYDPNGRNSRQDVLEEIERRLRLKALKEQQTALESKPRKPQRPSK